MRITRTVVVLFLVWTVLWTKNAVADPIKKFNQVHKQLAELEQKIDLNRSQKNKVQRKIEQQKRVNAKLSADNKAIKLRIKQHKKLLAQQLRQLQKIQHQPLLKRLISAENYSKTLRHKYALAEFRRSHINTTKVLELLFQQSSEKEQLFNKKIQTLNNQIKKLQILEQKLLKRQNERKKQIIKLKKLKQDKKVSSYIPKMVEQKISAAEKRSTTKKVGSLKHFASLKGKMTWPMNGTVKTLDGYKLGWRISKDTRSFVHSVAAGTIVSISKTLYLGLTIIINHGNEYRSVYATLKRPIVKEGDSITARQIIAESSNSGGREDYGVFFQLRRNKRPVNFKRWIKKTS